VTVAPVEARKTWRTLEPVHGMVYFVPEGPEVYESIGLRGARVGYFGSRAAAFGPAPAEVVISTFYNFCPSLVRRCIPSAWEMAAPADILAARLEVVDRALTRLLGNDLLESSDLAEAADLSRRAAESINGDLAGRPLFAAHASLDWPAPAHLVLWHAQTLLREYRGDGHIAALVMSDLDPVETLVSHAATGDVPADVLKATRAWPQEDWDAGVHRLVERGLVVTGEDRLALTEQGRRLRQDIEDATDMAAVRPYGALGADGCARLRQLGRPISQAVVGAGGLNADPKRLLG
jgi:hypothetical protein